MMPDTINNYLNRQGVRFDLVRHRPTVTSQETAQAAHIPGDRFAKAVVLEDGEEFLLAVIPATHMLDHRSLNAMLQRPVYLAREEDFCELFRDCRPGAVPALGPAYGVKTIVDDALLGRPDVYFESGDHEQCVHVDRDAFASLMREAEHGTISHHA